MKTSGWTLLLNWGTFVAFCAIIWFFILKKPVDNPALKQENDSLRTANKALHDKLDSVIANINTRDPLEQRIIRDTVYLVRFHESNRNLIRALPFDTLLRRQSVQLDDSI